MTTTTLKGGDFNAQEFVNALLEEGRKIPCDDSQEAFNRNELPPFYDHKLYKRGQEFFSEHIFAAFYSKFLGLLSLLAIPSIVKILIHTNMSNTNMTSYRRYLGTLFHMRIWYEDDFTPGSRLWRSLKEVKSKHNSASKKGCAAGINKISQMDMALTQFGFMGFAIATREKVGFHNIPEEEWKGFLHIWRVVGYIMGMENRFNICRESVEETTEICKLLIDKSLRPAIERQDEDFLKMSKHLITGMWSMQPFLHPRVFPTILSNLVQQPAINNNENAQINEIKPIFNLTLFEKCWMYFLIFTIWTLQFKIFRIYHGLVQYISLWLMNVFPFLAYYQFGKANSHVVIVPEICDEKNK